MLPKNLGCGLMYRFCPAMLLLVRLYAPLDALRMRFLPVRPSLDTELVVDK
tara:strand:+ start:268 stop:420 length:153 start_codon:yes stop_codon:yes gene_type:complete